MIFSTRLAHACPRGRVALSSSTRNFWSDGLRRSVRDAPDLRPPVCLTALALDTWHAPPRGCPSPPNARAGAPSAARRLGRPRMVCRPGVPLVGSPLGRKVGYPVITSTSGRGGTYLTARARRSAPCCRRPSGVALLGAQRARGQNARCSAPVAAASWKYVHRVVNGSWGSFDLFCRPFLHPLIAPPARSSLRIRVVLERARSAHFSACAPDRFPRRYERARLRVFAAPFRVL